MSKSQESIIAVPFLDIRAATLEMQNEIEAAALDTIRSGWYLLGDRVADFEARFSEFCQVSNTVGVGNGLDALTLSLRALGVGPGDEVVVPANTYIATWLAVTAVGATVVPIEPEPSTFLPSVDCFEAAVTERTVAFLPVHLYGRPLDMKALAEVAGRNGVRVLEDCAQAHGASWQGKPVGTSDVGAWSFYPGKNLGALGDGGAVTTGDDSMADKIRMLRNYGSRRKYHNEQLGVNSRLDEIQAAILSVKLKTLMEWNDRRSRVAKRYAESLGHLEWLNLPTDCDDGVHAWHLYVVTSMYRDQLQEHLDRSGIATLIHYPVPPHLQPAYGYLERRAGSFPVTELLAMTSLSIPMGPHLDESSQERVIDAVLRFNPSISKPVHAAALDDARPGSFVGRVK
jgi:dTDP-3-amino-3,4,6-trideoxy-alpha-D-glucose transaminase